MNRLQGVHVLILLSLSQVSSFTPLTPTKLRINSRFSTEISSQKSHESDGINRRKFMSNAVMTGLISQIITGKAYSAVADDDLTSQLFNEDGSLKEGSSNGMTAKEIEAKERSVNMSFPSASDDSQAIVSVDGKETGSGVGIKATYNLPEKWTSDYLDTMLTLRDKACDRITVYQVPGTFTDFNTLEKATTIGVAKALGFSSVASGVLPKSLPGADIVTGRKVSKAASSNEDEKDKRKYYEFDMALAPDKCGSSAENLGLGFCPYESIVLLSATIIDGKMMVCGITCTKDEWKTSNADLKRVRNSFFVEKAIA
jgi:hypothetical protein